MAGLKAPDARARRPARLPRHPHSPAIVISPEASTRCGWLLAVDIRPDCDDILQHGL